MALLIMRNCADASLFHRQSGLGAVKGLNLALFIDAEHDGMSGRIEVKPGHIAQFINEFGIVGQLELLHPVRLQTMRLPDALQRTDADARSPAIIAPVQCVISPGGSVSVNATTRAATPLPSGLIREGRVLSRKRPSSPSDIKRSCQRQTQVFEVPVSRTIACVPKPSADKSTIRVRQTWFCGVLRSLAKASSRS